jgi:hypothetical protein
MIGKGYSRGKMNLYKNRYGLDIALILFGFWSFALHFRMPELLEVAGAAVILLSMWVWKYDCESFKPYESSKTLEELVFSIQSDLRSLKSISQERTDNITNKKLHELSYEELRSHLEETIKSVEITNRISRLHMKKVINLIEYNYDINIVKNNFISIEFLLISCGTIYWACGTYIYKGWHSLFDIIL